MERYWFYPARYRQATLHMSDLADLAYRRIIDWIMETERAPREDELARISGLALEVWWRVEDEVKRHMSLEEDGWHNRTCDAAFAARAARSEKYRQNGRLRGTRPKPQDFTLNPLKTQGDPAIAKQLLSNSSKAAKSPSPPYIESRAVESPSQISLNWESVDAGGEMQERGGLAPKRIAKRKPRSFVPEDFQLNAGDLAACQRHKLEPPRARDNFINYNRKEGLLWTDHHAAFRQQIHHIKRAIQQEDSYDELYGKLPELPDEPPQLPAPPRQTRRKPEP